jgi:DNA-binding IclR family transcriptional regulator
MPRPSPQTERVVAVIDHLAGHPEGATLTELAGAVGADRSAFVHVLAALTTSGVLYREPGDRRYHLGPALVRPGLVAADRYGELAAARVHMDRLADDLGLHCLSFVREHDHGRLVQYVWPRGATPPAIPVGETLPMRPPLGLLFVAWGSAADLDEWLDLEPELGADDRRRFHEQAAAVRSLGFVVEARPRTMEDAAFARLIDDRTSPRRDGKLLQLLAGHGPAEHILTDLDQDGTRHDVHVIGAPTFGPDGAVSRSISVIGFTGPIPGAEVARIGAAVRATADRVTAELGGRPPASPRRRPRRAAAPGSV